MGFFLLYLLEAIACQSLRRRTTWVSVRFHRGVSLEGPQALWGNLSVDTGKGMG